ncbi:MAG: peptidoglycan DD-metalloendopeptidase family protein [Gammaproteobacteria bacterium]|nr:peptidoglycan DD-metalloendopeptidase family protein [Gammaproteobacteria bacterium]
MQKYAFSLKHFLIVSLLSAFLATTSLVRAEDEDHIDYKNKLEDVRAKIARVLGNLNETQNQRNNIKDQLQKLERKIAKTSKNLRQIRRKQANSKKTLKQLNTDLTELKLKLSQQKDILSRQIRSAYAMGQQAHLKMVLNQQQPTEMGRAMIYFNYLNTARTQQIYDFLDSIDKKQKLEIAIIATNQELEQLAKQSLDQKQSLTGDRTNRKQLLAKLNEDINNQKLTLSELENSRNRIESLLSSLGELLADIPNETQLEKPFSDLKGKMPWPVKGKFLAHFGDSRNQGDLTWNGVVIKSAYGTPVRAINYGRVAFADWLQGFGFITIIDHDNEYMSLYGHNQALYKEVGDWVEAGEIIATVGDSGGQEHSGLYFEIRFQGKPINPDSWCSASIR